MEIDKSVYKKSNMIITGATLLSIEEAEKLPYYLRKYNHWWWLRSPEHFQSGIAPVNHTVLTRYNGDFVSYHGGCVRPALHFSNFGSSNFQIGDRFEFGGKEFEIITDNLAFCTSDIGCCAFRENWAATDAIDYEKSDVKKFVDEWFTCAERK